VASLVVVHVLMVLHFVHWKVAGRTLAPLEFSEAMITLEIGVVTAGFLFMGLALLSAAVFGRFFCAWACHILALEDLCAWALKKLGLRPNAVRSRLLLLVPPAAFFYMFLWPQVSLLLRGEPTPAWRLAGEGEPWASFVTDDYWHMMPTLGVAILSVIGCGFLVVYVLGSRSFCRYVCPYGAALAVADRLSPGRIVRVGSCDGCGACTAACSSGVNVHAELDAYGTVVDSGCLKSLDCISACPNGAIRWSLTKPSLLRGAFGLGASRRRFSVTLGEDLLIAAVFLVTFFVVRGLYGIFPFLLSLTIAAMLAIVALLGVRLVKDESVKAWRTQLKVQGKCTRAGFVVGGLALALGLLLAHSALVRTHEWLGVRAFDRIGPEAPDATRVAREHLETAERWGLAPTPAVEGRLESLYLSIGEPARAVPYLRHRLARAPGDDHLRLHLARTLFASGEAGEAERLARAVLDDPECDTEAGARAAALLGSLRASAGDAAGAILAYREALELAPEDGAAHRALGELLSSTGDFEGAARHLARAVELEPDVAAAHYNLAVLLARLGREEEALEHYQRAAQLDPTDPDTWNNLGFLLAARSELAEAERCFRRAIERDETRADPHFNLARLLTMLGRDAEARAELERAAELDPRYRGE